MKGAFHLAGEDEKPRSDALTFDTLPSQFCSPAPLPPSPPMAASARALNCSRVSSGTRGVVVGGPGFDKEFVRRIAPGGGPSARLTRRCLGSPSSRVAYLMGMLMTRPATRGVWDFDCPRNMPVWQLRQPSPSGIARTLRKWPDSTISNFSCPPARAVAACFS